MQPAVQNSLAMLFLAVRTRPRCRQKARAVCIERLESRTMLAFDPSAQAQEMLEHVNRMRVNPQAELNVLFSNLNPLTARDPDANAAIRHFNDPTSAGIQSEWSSLRPTAPLAWNESLVSAATGHSQLMVQHDQQSHQVPGEPGLSSRLANAGYVRLSAAGENVFAYAKNVFNAHSAFAIDWAVSGRGHRVNLMNPSYRDFGVGLAADDSASTRVGPLVTTQNFGSRFDYGNPYLLGVVYRDANTNGRYDAGEGVRGASIQVTGPSGTFTTTTMSAGGYQLKVPGGTYVVTASGGGLTSPHVRSGVLVASTNTKVDFTGTSAPPAVGVPGMPTQVVAAAGDRSATVTWQAPVSNGGGAITNYVIQFSGNGGGTWTTVNRAASPATAATATGLVNGTNYVFRVAAVNSAGAGGYSLISNSVRPAARIATPASPTGVVANAGNGRVTLRWNAPASNGGSAITRYAVQSSTDGGRTWETAAIPASTRTSASVTGLNNGTQYVFRVAAVNAAGTGAYTAPTASVAPVAGALTPIDLTVFANRRLQSVGYGAVGRLPEGNVTLGGIGFAIPVGGNNVWTGEAARGGNPRALDVPVNAFGVTRVHTLINTLWGERDNGARASITFFGSAGAMHTVELDGNNHIRDYLWNTWTNTINRNSAVNVFTAGSGKGIGSNNQVRLDMQTFTLPTAFANQTLTRVRISDWGGSHYQRLIVSGITIH
jgi:hypothetical protein